MDIDIIPKLREFFSRLPYWAKVVVSISIAAITAILLLTSCGSTTKVVTRTSDSASVNISISAPSTTDTDVDVNPDIDFKITRYNSKRL